MLFKDYHIPMIRSGSKTVTRREWDGRQAVPGNVYQATSPAMNPDAPPIFIGHDDCDCYIRATDVYEQPLGEMTDADARAEGDYDDLDGFRQGYERVYGEGSWDPEKVVWVVGFEYVGESRPQKRLLKEGRR